MLLYCFILHSYGAHPDLHSFPTRRSSDLEPCRMRKATATVKTTSPGLILPLLHSDRAQIDRKSTRLNSSHLGISYAVFCLKKKIEQNKREVREPKHEIQSEIS